jgi:hypothetical protein
MELHPIDAKVDMRVHMAVTTKNMSSSDVGNAIRGCSSLELNM